MCPAGWGLVAAGFLTFGVSAGMMHSYPVFFVAFLAAFGWGRAEASVAYSASQLLTGASSRSWACWSIASDRGDSSCSAASCSPPVSR